jgi:hypothetical protein
VEALAGSLCNARVNCFLVGNVPQQKMGVGRAGCCIGSLGSNVFLFGLLAAQRYAGKSISSQTPVNLGLILRAAMFFGRRHLQVSETNWLEHIHDLGSATLLRRRLSCSRLMGFFGARYVRGLAWLFLATHGLHLVASCGFPLAQVFWV